jgi:flagellar brake protein
MGSPGAYIEHPEEFGQFMLNNRREIIYYLNLLIKQHCLFTAYINEGEKFFLTAIVAVDEEAARILLDPEQAEEHNTSATVAQKITLVANLDSVKIQMRLPALQMSDYQSRSILSAPIPETILRLQRRDFFRLVPPISKPIRCKVTITDTAKLYDLQLSDISGGGVCLIGPTTITEHFPRNAMFPHCRLEIPGDGVIQVSLRVRKTVEMSDRNGRHSLRIGCEFVGLPSARLAFIERYITRIERERKARDYP